MKKLLIVGSGISGITSAHLLRNQFEITIIEKNDYLGGHTHTHHLENENENYDSGFIVFNNKNYPNFIKLLKELGVEYQKSNMSFSVLKESIKYEWAGKNIRTIFNLKNLFTIRYLKVLKDIIRFSKICENASPEKNLTLKNFLEINKFSKEFVDLYFYPMCSSIWSSNLNDIQNYNATFILKFFKNHGLHNMISKRPTWYTIKNGSKTYIDTILNKTNFNIHKNEKVIEVDQIKKVAKTHSGKLFNYDSLILATHSDQSLKILNNKTLEQENLLASIKYQENNVTIHTDETVMPKKKKNWSSWNFKYSGETLVLTYWMNLLQNLKCKPNILVTLNSNEIDEDKIIKKIKYTHPLFTKPKEEIVEILNSTQGKRDVWFAGAWLGYGFHEDGVNSAINVYNLLNAR